MLLPDVQAAILAGGQSRRMGRPKLFLDFRGNTFVAHLLLQLQQQVNEVMIAGVPVPHQLADLGVLVLPDAELSETKQHLGPLGGVVTALRHARRQWLLLVPCDNPVLPPDYASRMLHIARAQQAPLVYVRKQGREQPLYAIVKRDLLPDLDGYLASGGRKVLPWYESVGAVALDWDDAGSAFTNLNTPEEYDAFIVASQSP